MDYDALFTGSLETLKADGSYRHFAQLERSVGRFPAAWHRGANRKVTVWCSNDYLGMGQNPVVKKTGKCNPCVRYDVVPMSQAAHNDLAVYRLHR
jgi:7-keto-8-aminopelargonate synthetase-like enzyme